MDFADEEKIPNTPNTPDIPADPELKEYTCNAKVQARPMKRGEYNLHRGWETPADENPDDDGLLCLREDGSEAWVPKELFLSTHVDDASISKEKTLHNSEVSGASKNVKDIVFCGDVDLFQLLFKASSQREGWMKSTKAMDCGGGVLVQVTTRQRNPDGSYSCAEALSFVPGVFIVDSLRKDGGRYLAPVDATVDATPGWR